MNFFEDSIVGSEQYAVIGADVLDGPTKDYGGVFDEKTGSWQFRVYARPFYMTKHKTFIGWVRVNADGSVTALPSKEQLTVAVDDAVKRLETGLLVMNALQEM